MKVADEALLNAPIPGESLTAEPKSRPWRRPYQASSVDDAMALYAPVFKNKKAVKMMLQQIENGVALTTIADLLITANTMEGRHSLDVGILIAPVLVETMIAFAEMAEIDYVVGNEDRETPEERTELVNRAVKKIKQSEDSEEDMATEEELPEEVEEMIEADEPKGLMARRSARQ